MSDTITPWIRPWIRAWFAVALLLACHGPTAAAAQEGPALHGRVLDATVERPVSGAWVRLQPLDVNGAAWIARIETAVDGSYRFDSLALGRYELSVGRFGYRTASIEITLHRSDPLFATVRLDPLPFPMASIDLRVSSHGGPSLQPPSLTEPASRHEARASAERTRLSRSLSADARHLSYADLREANTLGEHDLLRTIQRLPGVGARDGFTADLWTRGAPAAQTTVHFDGIPVLGGLHLLGGLTGLNTDMLSTATFHPGVVGASVQGGGAAIVDVTSRSGLSGSGSRATALSPFSIRASADGRAGDRIGWAVGARRSHLDALSSAAAALGMGSGQIPYVFRDATARLDAIVSERYRVEASGFWQDDRLSGDVSGLAYGNEGEWGTAVGRISLVGNHRSAVVRHTLGVSNLGASLREVSSGGQGRRPLHPTTEGGYRALVWESRLDARAGRTGAWSLGVRASHETHEYTGPGVDLARLLSQQEFERRGIGDLTAVIEGLRRAEMLQSDAMTRLAAWGEWRMKPIDALEVEAGLRVESGSPVGESRVRLAPRARVRWHPEGSSFAVTAGAGRSFQYVQSLARTDVVRSGLRASEVLVQAGSESPALRSDEVALAAEAWAGPSWVFGSALWLRTSSGVLVPDPRPGIIDTPRSPVAAVGLARGLELSVRRVDGPIRGFANYTLSRARQQVGALEFDASEDRRHMANIGVTAELPSSWQLGATATAQGGAPYTRITLVDADCDFNGSCASGPPVMYGMSGLQRARAYVSLDLMAERTFDRSQWSFTVYGQLRNVLGRRNAVTYHSSCICARGPDGATGLHDQFDDGLPRLPLIGVRARFR